METNMRRVRRTVLLNSLALFVAAPVVMGQSPKRVMTIDDMMALKNVGAAAISPNGALVVYQVSAWEHPSAAPAKGDTALGDKHDIRSHLWLVPSDASRPARQITFSERGESSPQWSPDGSAIAF